VRNVNALVLLIAVIGTSSACKSVGEYVWVDDIPPTPRPVEHDYIISKGDLISVRVWGQETMSARTRVRADGKISLPFLNDVDAAGVPPTFLARQLEVALKGFLANPIVTVSLEERRLLSVPVLGEVVRKGTYDLEPGANVLQALAAAGGLGEFASHDRVFVLRPSAAGDSSPASRIRFDYDLLTRGTGRGPAFRLQAGDMVVVE
jgi:polysaccharide export outer membrane protein